MVAAPPFVEMPVAGLVGGRCPLFAAAAASAGPGALRELNGDGEVVSITQSVVVRRTDARADVVEYALNVTVLSARDRSPTHSPADGAEFNAALRDTSARIVIQLRAGVAYSGYGNLYAAFRTGTSAAQPIVVLGASGAVLSEMGLDNVGHVIFENVDFNMTCAHIQHDPVARAQWFRPPAAHAACAHQQPRCPLHQLFACSTRAPFLLTRCSCVHILRPGTRRAGLCSASRRRQECAS